MWKSEAPTEAGWYWWRTSEEYPHRAVKLFKLDVLWVSGIGDYPTPLNKIDDCEWWSEPIQEPSNPKEAE
jgi:hypothetical protein